LKTNRLPLLALLKIEPVLRKKKLGVLKQGTDTDMMRTRNRHWLDYDPVALAVLFIGLGIVELLALNI
jgi:hypothetical protein